MNAYKGNVCVGVPPSRGEYGLAAKRVLAYSCALLPNVCEWFKHHCMPQEAQPLRVLRMIRRDMQVAAWVTRHTHTLTCM